jgi:hypothetical protein
VISNIQVPYTNISWYFTEDSTEPLGPNDRLISHTYWAEININEECTVTERVPVVITIGIPDAPSVDAEQSFCSPATIASLAVTGYGITWYASEDATTPLDPLTPLVHGATYWVVNKAGDCESERIAVRVYIFENVNPPTLESPLRLCVSGGVELTLEYLKVITGQNIKWYATETSEEVLPMNTVLVNGATYWASQTLGICESGRSYVTVYLDPDMEVPAPELISPQEFCAQGVNTLNDLITGNYNLVWYLTEFGGEPLDPNTPLNSYTTYWAAQEVGNCESTSRTPVLVIYRSVIQITVPIDPQAFCEGAILSDIVTPYNNLTWYATETSTEPLPWYTMLETGSYWASVSVGECESVVRTEVPVTIGAPANVITNKEQAFCVAATIADLYVQGQGVKWYASLDATEPLPLDYPLVDGATYYAANSNGDCEGERVGVTVRIIPTPETPTIADNALLNVCDGDIIDVEFLLNAINIENETEYLFFFDVDCTIPFVKPIITDRAIAESHTFYVLARNTIAGCLSDIGEPLVLTIYVDSMPVVVQGNLIYCDGDEVPEYAFVGTENSTFYWEKIVGEDFGLIPTSGVNTIPAFLAQNYGFEYVQGLYKVTPVNEHGCVGKSQLFLITVNPRPITTPVSDMIYCNGTTAPRFDFTSNIPDAYYVWEFVNETGSVMIQGVSEAGENYIPSFPAINDGNEPISGTYRVRASYSYDNHTCDDGVWQYFHIIILPTPGIPTITPVSQTICSGEATTPITFGNAVEDVTYSWEFNSGDVLQGFPLQGEGNIQSYIITNPEIFSVSANYKVWAVLNYLGHACESSTATFSITVNPEVTTDPVPDFVYCNGETTSVYTFTGNNTLATYAWEFVSGADLGIPQNGANSFPTFIATNTENVPITAIYRVKANYGNCNSEWIMFSVTVLPTPTVVATPTHQTICSGETTLPIEFTGNVEDVIYRWHRLSGNIPDLPLDGDGDFDSYTIENTGSANMDAIYEVTPILNYPEYPGYSCPGNPTQFSITVLPQPHINTIPQMVYCNAQMTQGFEFGNTSGVTYTWQLTNGVNVGLPEYGTGQLPSFIAINESNNEVLEAIYEVTASYSTYGYVCTHSVTFSIIVNPTPSLELNIEPFGFCAEEETPVIDFVELFASLNNNEETVYDWYYVSGNYIGLDQTSGTNVMPSFVAINNSNQQTTATYKVIAKFGRCTSVERSFVINVTPKPGIASQTHAGTTCSGTLFEYSIIPTVKVDGISWIRVPNPDINDNEGASGNDAYISETLYNTTTSDVEVRYLITLQTGACEYENIGEVVVVVTPIIEFNINPITIACNNEKVITLEYDINIQGAQFTLVFGQEGNAVGFVSVIDYIPLPESGIVVNIPPAATFGNYSAKLTLKYGKCIKTYDIVIAVKSTPVAKDMSEATLMLCENENLYLFVDIEGYVQYQWYFNGDILTNETKSYYETNFDITKEGEYSVEISNECGTFTYHFNVILNPTLIKMKWNDVIYVPNTDGIYVDYQWYKNGQPVASNGTDQYYSEKGGFTPHAEYNVKAYKADGTYDEACPIIPNNISKGSGANLTVYPNPIQTGTKVTFLLQLPEGELTEADAYIYDMNGKLVSQFKITNYITEVLLNVATGTYTVRVITENSDEFVEKIVIQK